VPEADISSAGAANANTTLQSAFSDANEGKRASQIVYATGSVVNRLVTPALAAPALGRCSVPIELRGTKLLLHKPLGDRAAGVRELFAVGVVEDDPVSGTRYTAIITFGNVAVNGFEEGIRIC
jgi:hypothetical protein